MYHQQLLIWMHGLTDCYRAAALVLKAQEEAFSSLNGIGHAKLGTMTALVAAANTTVQEVANDLQMSLKFPTASPCSPKAAGSMDNVGILKVCLTPLLIAFKCIFDGLGMQ
ncbi:unnamed protein product [Sphagnum troendelagicum]|uniref:VAN3-binding protein-like auxin canalisation domain-containing protein n=1 Tax=Sphagnum troendelagicum TaxID=128251 RepID=A0ABP0UFN1_9BRYO